ncbi:MAG: hypothetical protein DME69_14445 [Verrucomicrobia bacterium]|nr:MAG: hypothetical protein DME69_14445 [Verrucomicrobiota bacterium]
MQIGGMNGVETRGTISELHATARESVSPFHYYRILFRTAELASHVGNEIRHVWDVCWNNNA